MARSRSWDPVSELVTMQQAMDRVFDEVYSRRDSGWRRGERVRALPVDVYSTPNELVIQASVPGLQPDDVEITIEGETLTIRGERKAPLENVDWYIQERRYGAFARTLTLSVPVQSEEAEAVFENGELTLTIPKAEEVRPKVIRVKGK